MRPIPHFDLLRAIEPVRPEVEARWQALLTSGAFVGGEQVAAFESAFAEFVGAAACVGVANGTDALVLALRALDLAPGDEVIVPSFTFIATAAAVTLVGGVPVFCDIDDDTFNLDLAKAESVVGERTVGVIGVHLYGRPFDVDRTLDLCHRNKLWLIEDAAQAHGAEWRGARVGNFGHLATWSFYPAKNLGCFGDGGALTGPDAELLARVRRLADHGRLEHYLHAEPGMNSRLDGLQAAVLNCRLPHLDDQNQRRREIAARYRAALTGVGDLKLLVDLQDHLPVYHQMAILTHQRDRLRQHLEGAGVGTAIHYPLALHRQPAFAHAVFDESRLEISATAGDRVLCLPMFPQLTDAEVDRVCSVVREFFG